MLWPSSGLHCFVGSQYGVSVDAGILLDKQGSLEDVSRFFEKIPLLVRALSSPCGRAGLGGTDGWLSDPIPLCLCFCWHHLKALFHSFPSTVSYAASYL